MPAEVILPISPVTSSCELADVHLVLFCLSLRLSCTCCSRRGMDAFSATLAGALYPLLHRDVPLVLLHAGGDAAGHLRIVQRAYFRCLPSGDGAHLAGRTAGESLPTRTVPAFPFI
eukprot:3482584-Pleurochrysis_carterae.AAC.4